MTKGFEGQSCSEAINQSVGKRETLAFDELFQRVKKRGGWKDETIWQHLMGLIVNLPPARLHWKSMDPFLFLRPDGQYELYDADTHPPVQAS